MNAYDLQIGWDVAHHIYTPRSCRELEYCLTIRYGTLLDSTRFLCYLHLPRWRGDRVLVGGGAPPVDPDVVTKLPKAEAEDKVGDPAAQAIKN